jgi:hypothetical protein
MKKSKQSVFFNEDIMAEHLVKEAERSQLQAKDRMDAIEGIKRGLESVKYRRGKPAMEFFDAFFAEKGIFEHE